MGGFAVPAFVKARRKGTVYESFESAAVSQSGKVPLPCKDERSIGGHAVLTAGYDDRHQHFLVMNSWSGGLGRQGLLLPALRLRHQRRPGSDFWTVRVMET